MPEREATYITLPDGTIRSWSGWTIFEGEKSK